MAERWKLKGKHIIVTGGTKGIGKAIVEECAALGAKVFTCARNPEIIQECSSNWESKGYDIVVLAADFSSDQGRLAFLQSIEGQLQGKVDGLVNNVGTNIGKKAVEYTEEEVKLIMQTNLHSAFHFTRLLYPFLKSTAAQTMKGVSVVNISSVAGGCQTALRSGVVYVMTKAALTQMTYNLSCEWAVDRIRVNSICPWYINTPLAAPVLNNPEALSQVLARTPMQRVGEAEEVSGIVAFLMMDQAGFISGQAIAVDGAFLRNGFF